MQKWDEYFHHPSNLRWLLELRLGYLQYRRDDGGLIQNVNLDARFEFRRCSPAGAAAR